METALVLVAPALQGFVDLHRHPSDMTASLGIPAHVTVLYPWVQGQLDDAQLDRCAQVVRDVGPVRMTFRRMATFPQGVLYLVPEPEDRLRELTQLLVRAYPDCLPYGGEFPDPQPHLTVTTGPPEELKRLEARAAEELAPTECTVDTMSVLEQQTDSRWRIASELALTG